MAVERSADGHPSLKLTGVNGYVASHCKEGGPYSAGLGKTEANYASLSPLSFLPKAAETYPNRIALIHGEQRRTWAETYARCRRLASALHKRGIGPDDTVAVMAPTFPPFTRPISASR